MTSITANATPVKVSPPAILPGSRVYSVRRAVRAIRAADNVYVGCPAGAVASLIPVSKGTAVRLVRASGRDHVRIQAAFSDLGTSVSLWPARP